MMERQVGQTVRLVDDLLDVSRISRGKIELRRGRIELASAINHAVEAIRSLVQLMEHDLVVTLGKNIVIVALTGWGQEEDREKSRNAGFDSHMVKPVDFAALTKLLAESPRA